jgi:hypothetical protein
MVYLAGDNDLDPNGREDLKEMKSVGTTADINVVAQFDSKAAGHRTMRYLLTKGSVLDRDIVGRLGNTNTGDPKNLIDFATWAITNYPARRYFLVLWNHGAGWDDTDVFAGERHRSLRRLSGRRVRYALFHKPVRKLFRAARHDPEKARILRDDNAKDFLDNHEMKGVVEAVHRKLGRKLDLLGMDACLMSMPEVGYQMRNDVAFTVGSEADEPRNGWPYREILGRLARTPDMTPDALGKAVVKEYLASYREDWDFEELSQSLCDLGQCTALAVALKALGTSLTTALGNPVARSAVRAARNQVQSYSRTKENVDLWHLCTLVKAGAVHASVKGSCDAVVSALNKYVISSRTNIRNAKGAAIYFPQRSVSPLYGRLDFVKETGWDRFLKAYLR